MYRALLQACLIGLTLLFAGVPGASATEVQQAERLYQDGKYKEAIAILNVYLKSSPSDATALVDRGTITKPSTKNKPQSQIIQPRWRSIRITRMRWPPVASRIGKSTNPNRR